MVWYFAGMLALLFLAAMIGPLWVVAAALLIAVWWQRRQRLKIKHLFERNWAIHPDVSDISPNLGKIMAELYERSGLDPEKYPLYDFRLCDKDRKMQESEDEPGEAEYPENDDGLQKAVDILRRKSETYLAAVLYAGQPVLAVAAPVLALLDDEEERAVLAHELVHLREKHIYTAYAMTILCTAVIFAVTLVRLVWFFEAGWEEAVYASMSGITAGFFITGKIKKGMSRRKKYKFFFSCASIISALVMTVFTPVYLFIYFATYLMKIAAWTILRGRSRTSEYRADAGIVNLGASPLAMMTALRRMQHLQDEAVEKAGASERLNARTLGNWMRKNLFATHPDTDCRLDRLAEMARRLGYAQDEIRAARYGDIEMDKTHSYPLWMIEYMRAQ
ncbi:MAG: hypothetical protein EA357_03080 [Micavibrio sp.]|nr:MAG: hypothetical protein EA357_03080 [Micavibrio sp.]